MNINRKRAAIANLAARENANASKALDQLKELGWPFWVIAGMALSIVGTAERRIKSAWMQPSDPFDVLDVTNYGYVCEPIIVTVNQGHDSEDEHRAT